MERCRELQIDFACADAEQHVVCAHVCGTVWLVVCGRLFELDPELLSLFHYTANCGSTQDCLSSPEFLEHVTKVSSVGRPTPQLRRGAERAICDSR